MRFYLSKYVEVADLSLWSAEHMCVGIPEACVGRDSGCTRYSMERSHFPSLNLLLFLFCKSGLRIKIYFDICLGHYRGGSSHIEADGRMWITYLVTVVEIDVDKFANFRQSHTFSIRPKEKRICMWNAGNGVSEFRLVMHHTTGEANKVRRDFPPSWT